MTRNRAILLTLACIALALVSYAAWAADGADPVNSLSVVLQGGGIVLAVLGAILGVMWLALQIVRASWTPVGRHLDQHEAMYRQIYGDGPAAPGLAVRVRSLEDTVRDGDTSVARAIDALRDELISRGGGDAQG